MKVLLWTCALACAGAAKLPACSSNRRCIARYEYDRHNRDGWFSNDYLVDGKRMSVATRETTIRWMCWGTDPTSDSAPHFSPSFTATEVELINCTTLPMSYPDLFKKLTLEPESITKLTISTQPQHMDVFPSMEQLDLGFHRNSLQHLSLRGVPMSTEQLTSLYRMRTLTLVDSGLTRVVNLSEFSKLYRLELHEPMLEDAQLLGTAPALEELVLCAPDAGLAPMPFLRVATFLDVYATGSIFGDCKKLEALTIDGGDLDHIREHWLAGCTSLTSLKLTRLQYLRDLPDDLLADTTNLRKLDLSFNSLDSLPDGLFSNTKYVTSLNLRDNSLKALSAYSLPKSLRYMCLAGNSQVLDMQPNKFHDQCDNTAVF